MSRRRTLIVTSNFPPVRGGSCVVYDRLAKYSDGYVSVLAPSVDFRTGVPFADAAAHDAQARYAVRRIPILRPLETPGRGRTRRTLGDIATVSRVLAEIAALCLTRRIDVVCIGDLVYGGWLIWPVRHLLRRPVIVYVHGEELTAVSDGLSERLKSRFLRMADAVVTVSRFARDAAISIGGADPARIHIIPNGVDLELFQPRAPSPALLERYGIAGKRIIVTVARLVERKGIDAVLRALPEVLRAVPDARYVVVGDGPDRARLVALAEELGVADRVVFAGTVTDDALVDHYAIGDVFAMPNRRLANGDNEGFGLVFLEANACGKPVVAGNAGGTADAVTDGANGLLVDGTRADAVAGALIRLLTDHAAAARMRDEGLRIARTSGWDLRATDFQALADRLVVGPAPAAAAPVPARLPPRPRAALADLNPLTKPTLLVLVDAEEEFDWGRISSQETGVRTMRHQQRAHDVFARYQLRPMYLVDYPVASQPDGYRPLQEWLADGACDVGSQLHAWVNPPIEETVSAYTSFPGNLPEALERAKLARLTDEIELRFGVRPVVYRAGRYGAGPNTARILADLGYRIDCSVLPYNDFSDVGGPDYSDWTAAPVWLDRDSGLLELPATVGFAGSLARRGGGGVYRAITSVPSALRMPGIFARAGLLERIKLTPEGTSLAEAKRLTRAMLAGGHRVFAITYHSPSLDVGHTPYVRTTEDLRRFLDWLDGYCAFFMNELGGVPSTAAEVHAVAARERRMGERRVAAE